MRTTVRLPDDLLKRAKKLAAETDRSLTKLIEDALRETLARRGEAASAEPTSLRTVGGSGVQPGVDLDDTAALLELMESS